VFYGDKVILVAVRFNLTWACFLGCAGVAALGTVMAAADNAPGVANPYSVISDRNVFHLNPPPIPPDPDAAKPVDLRKIMLTGFVGKGTSMKVLLAIPPSKDGKDTITYLSLAPGDRDHDVQLVRIHLDKADPEVEIINAGTAQTLSGKSNSYAAMAAGPHTGGGPSGERGDKGVPGLHRPTIPGFTPPGTPPAPATAATQGEGSSVVIGGGGSQSGGAFVSGGASVGGGSMGGMAMGGASIGGGSMGGASISGGGISMGGGSVGVSGGANPGQYASSAAVGNSVGSQIANALSNPQGTHYQMPIPTAPPLPPPIQGAIMIAQKAAMDGGGPPLPPVVQAAAEGSE
jgi:hypothetical protein